jgi:hypothetical protein
MTTSSDPPDQPKGVDRITAVIRGPASVFLHWELSGPLSAQARSEFGEECRWVLRVLDITEGSSRVARIDPEVGNYYAAVEPGRAYGFQLAARSGDTWRTICRTDRVLVPPQAPDTSPRAAGTATLDKLRSAATRGFDVPGLTIESTPQLFSSSAGGETTEKQP